MNKFYGLCILSIIIFSCVVLFPGIEMFFGNKEETIVTVIGKEYKHSYTESYWDTSTKTMRTIYHPERYLVYYSCIDKTVSDDVNKNVYTTIKKGDRFNAIAVYGRFTGWLYTCYLKEKI